MNIEEVVKKRRGVRKFKDKEVSMKDVEELIALSNLSPSAGNVQARSVIIVKDKKIKDELKKTCPGFLKFPGEIPLIIVVLAVGRSFNCTNASAFVKYSSEVLKEHF